LIRTLGAAVVAALIVGCAAGSSSSSNEDAGTSAQAAVPVTTTKAPPPPARAKPAARRRNTRLAVSTASSKVVQPQPRPGSCHARGSGPFMLPDSHCTPGAISPAVTQANIHSTICVRGYTKTVRPSESITEKEKLASMDAYGDKGSPHGFEYDHLVSLELGGAPNDPRNLWPEPGASPNPKDRLEDRLRSLVCDGHMRLATAQTQIASNWAAAYHRLFG
jgi:hypothetical protein